MSATLCGVFFSDVGETTAKTVAVVTIAHLIAD